MDFGGLVFIGLIWLLFNLIGRSREDRTKAPPRRVPPPTIPGRDPTQREGSRLEQLLREIERAMDPAQPRPPVRRQTTVPQPPAEEVEERETLEIEPRVVSLETDVRRPQRTPVSLDDEAEAVIARRRVDAARRSGTHTRADHETFDRRIRQEPADHTAVRALTPEQLRAAVVWREVLGPPVSLRDS